MTQKISRVTRTVIRSKRLDWIRKIEVGTALSASVLIFMAIFLVRDGLGFNITSVHPETWAMLILIKTVATAFIFYLVARVTLRIVYPTKVHTTKMKLLALLGGVVIALIYLASKFLY